MDENKHFRCSFCGKTEQEVDKLLSGPGVYICNECIDMCNSILDGEFEHKGGFTATELPKPKERLFLMNMLSDRRTQRKFCL